MVKSREIIRKLIRNEYSDEDMRKLIREALDDEMNRELSIKEIVKKDKG